ncbi:HD domain-containing phosphohydrolase [Vulgatibacter incomptus]|uniref:Response regulator n=1 Tax=Vulgatibacter incomptus TaxID=1391653 RepID=A0A0K1PEB1_9BACT|nr:HD domain-containing phosphohydrolase [Vulgatibacter incomptus]AKU91741.1 Response regulator [Vulgatibacter incomptus]
MQPAPPHAPSILIVDDDPAVRDVLSALLVEEGYRCMTVADAESALAHVAITEPDLAICDLKMPARDGLWLLDRLRREHPDIAVIMLTGFGDTESAVECLRRGAADYLLKPPKLTELIRSIERALGRRRIDLARRRYQLKLEQRVEEKTTELQGALRAVEVAYTHTLSALVAALDAREHETSDHSQRVVRYTRAIAEQMGVRGPELGEICRGALLHDIGKIGVPDAILLKPGPLTPAEWQEMRRHPEIGFQILRGIRFLEHPSQIVLSHQERFDGKGYPHGLRGNEIPLGARIFAIADTLDAMLCDRPYRKGTNWNTARGEILRCSGTQFDPEAVRAFAAISDETWAELRRRRQEDDAADNADDRFHLAIG